MFLPFFRISLFAAFLLCLSGRLPAQSWDLGAFLGGSGYIGDLNPIKPYQLNDLAFGLQVKRSFDPYWAVKLAITRGNIQAADSLSSDEQLRARNLSFFTPLTEVSLQTEFNFFKYIPGSSRKRYTPFLFAGLGLVAFNPKTKYQGQVYELRYYGTEGQNISVPYRQYAVTLPFGAGFKYNLSGNWSLNAEAGYRKAFTDYLDDVSQKYPYPDQIAASGDADLAELRYNLSDPSANKVGFPGSMRGDYRKRDTYLFVGISITYSIFSSACPVVE